jgi:hypothetical protein
VEGLVTTKGQDEIRLKKKAGGFLLSPLRKSSPVQVAHTSVPIAEPVWFTYMPSMQEATIFERNIVT